MKLQKIWRSLPRSLLLKSTGAKPWSAITGKGSLSLPLVASRRSFGKQRVGSARGSFVQNRWIPLCENECQEGGHGWSVLWAGVCLPGKMCCCLKSQFLGMWPYLEIGFSQRWVGSQDQSWTETGSLPLADTRVGANAGVLVKRINSDTGTDMHRGKDGVQRQREDGHLIAKEHRRLPEAWDRSFPKPCEGTGPCWHLNFRLLASKTMRELISVVLSHLVCGTCNSSLRKLIVTYKKCQRMYFFFFFPWEWRLHQQNTMLSSKTKIWFCECVL